MSLTMILGISQIIYLLSLNITNAAIIKDIGPYHEHLKMLQSLKDFKTLHNVDEIGVSGDPHPTPNENIKNDEKDMKDFLRQVFHSMQSKKTLSKSQNGLQNNEGVNELKPNHENKEKKNFLASDEVKKYATLQKNEAKYVNDFPGPKGQSYEEFDENKTEGSLVLNPYLVLEKVKDKTLSIAKRMMQKMLPYYIGLFQVILMAKSGYSYEKGACEQWVLVEPQADDLEQNLASVPIRRSLLEKYFGNLVPNLNSLANIKMSPLLVIHKTNNIKNRGPTVSLSNAQAFTSNEMNSNAETNVNEIHNTRVAVANESPRPQDHQLLRTRNVYNTDRQSQAVANQLALDRDIDGSNRYAMNAGHSYRYYLNPERSEQYRQSSSLARDNQLRQYNNGYYYGQLLVPQIPDSYDLADSEMEPIPNVYDVLKSGSRVAVYNAEENY